MREKPFGSGYWILTYNGDGEFVSLVGDHENDNNPFVDWQAAYEVAQNLLKELGPCLRTYQIVRITHTCRYTPGLSES